MMGGGEATTRGWRCVRWRGGAGTTAGSRDEDEGWRDGWPAWWRHESETRWGRVRGRKWGRALGRVLWRRWLVQGRPARTTGTGMGAMRMKKCGSGKGLSELEKLDRAGRIGRRRRKNMNIYSPGLKVVLAGCKSSAPFSSALRPVLKVPFSLISLLEPA